MCSLRAASLPLSQATLARLRTAGRTLSPAEAVATEGFEPVGRIVEDQRFDSPVKILTGKASSVIRHVSTTAEAAHHLLNAGPRKKTAGKWDAYGKFAALGTGDSRGTYQAARNDMRRSATDL